MPVTVMDEDLAAFLEALPDATALPIRTLANAWASGGHIRVGKVALRLTNGDPAFTAATIHVSPARLELCRVLLERHGVDADRWQQWCDEFVASSDAFDAHAKYPVVAIDELSASELTRLVMGLRDLASWTA